MPDVWGQGGSKPVQPRVERFYGAERAVADKAFAEDMKRAVDNGSGDILDLPGSRLAPTEEVVRLREARRQDLLQFQQAMRLHDLRLVEYNQETVKAKRTVGEYAVVVEQLTAQLTKAKLKFEAERNEKERLQKIVVMNQDLAEQLQAMKERCSALTSKVEVANVRLKEARGVYKDRAHIAEEVVRLRKELQESTSDCIRERCAKTEHMSRLDAALTIQTQLQEMVTQQQGELRRLGFKAQDVDTAFDEVRFLKETMQLEQKMRWKQHVIVRANQAVARMKPQLGVIFKDSSKDGTKLKEVKPGFSAHRAGLRSGDVVTKVEGINTKTKADFYGALYGKMPGDTITVQIFRKDARFGSSLIPVKDMPVIMGARGFSVQQVLSLRRLSAEQLPLALCKEDAAAFPTSIVLDDDNEEEPLPLTSARQAVIDERFQHDLRLSGLMLATDAHSCTLEAQA